MSETISPFVKGFLDWHTLTYINPYQPSPDTVVFADSLGPVFNLEGPSNSGKTTKAEELAACAEIYGLTEFNLIRSTVTRGLRQVEIKHGTSYRHFDPESDFRDREGMGCKKLAHDLHTGHLVQAARHGTGHLYYIERGACVAGGINLVTLTTEAVERTQATGVFPKLPRIYLFPATPELWDEAALERDGQEMPLDERYKRVLEGLISINKIISCILGIDNLNIDKEIDEEIDIDGLIDSEAGISCVLNRYDGKVGNDQAAADMAEVMLGKYSQLRSNTALKAGLVVRNHFVRRRRSMATELINAA